MGEGRGGSFLETFDEKMYGYSVSVIFLEAVLKRQPAATETGRK